MISIITTTYNRGYIIRDLYESLRKQTDSNFEWIVIDDGSTDDTRKIFEIIVKNDNRFPIKYLYKENAGKHVALNYSHKYISGDLVFIVDSDDYLTTDAVESINMYWEKYKSNSSIACLVFERGNKEGIPFGREFMMDEFIGNNMDVEQNVFPGAFDTAQVIRADYFIAHPFVEYEGEKFLAEGYLWTSLAKKYNNVYIRKIIYICEYLSDGLTKGNRINQIKSPRGVVAVSELCFDERIALWLQIKKMLLYIAYGIIAGMTISELYNRIKRRKNRAMFVCILPLGIMLKKYRILRYGTSI